MLSNLLSQAASKQPENMFESLKQNQRFLTFVSFWQTFEPLLRVTLGAVHRQNEVWARSLPLQHLPAQQALAVSQYIAAIVHIRSSVLLVSSLWHFRLHSSAQQIGVCACIPPENTASLLLLPSVFACSFTGNKKICSKLNSTVAEFMGLCVIQREKT